MFRALLLGICIRMRYFSAFATSYDIYFRSSEYSRVALALAQSHILCGVALVYSQKSKKLSENLELLPFRRNTSLNRLRIF